MNLNDKRIWVTGHTGLVGSAVVRVLTESKKFQQIVWPYPRVDLRSTDDVDEWVEASRPDIVIHCAARCGGIQQNIDQPADIIHDNMLIDANVIHACRDVERFVYLSTVCAYPKDAPQPFQECAFLTGKPEPTNEAYAISKIAGMALLDAYRKQYGMQGFAVVPANVYGPGDRSTHVIPDLMRKIDACTDGVVKLRGTGAPVREFIYSDDLAEAIVFLIEKYQSSEPINVGTGESTSIHSLADTLTAAMGRPDVRFCFDGYSLDGIPEKTLGSTKIKLMGWKPRITLYDGLQKTWESMNA